MTNMKQYIESGNWKDLPENRWTIVIGGSGSSRFTTYEGGTGASLYRHETMANEYWRTFNESKKPLNQELLDYLLS